MNNSQYVFFENDYRNYEVFLRKFANDPKEPPFIDKNFHPYKVIEEDREKFYPDDKSITWERIDTIFPAPLFKKELISPKYIKQGKIGDCYLITALTRVSKQPYLVKLLFETDKINTILGQIEDSINLKCGIVVIYFYVFGRKTPVVIDTRIPIKNGRPLLSKPSKNKYSAWFCLVEKAFAKLKGSFASIDGGFFSIPIYLISGYYPKEIDVKNYPKTSTKPLIQKIMDYQKNNCIMDASIIESNGITIDEANNVNLHTKHSYLIQKVREENNLHFFLLRNPHCNKKNWNADYSSYYPLLSEKMQQKLSLKPSSGYFWMKEEDFFKYFNKIEVLKPFKHHWIVRNLHCTVYPLNEYSISDIKLLKLEQKQNYAIKLTEKINMKNARFHILVEVVYEAKCANRKSSLTTLIFSHSQGKKLDYQTLDTSKYSVYKSFSSVFSVSSTFDDQNDIITFTLITLSYEAINCYVKVFCDYDFMLYNIDKPNNPFPLGENYGIIFENYSITSPNSALPLKSMNLNGRRVLFFGEKTKSDFCKNRDEKIESLITENIKQIDSYHYCNQGAQIDLHLFEFWDKVLSNGPKGKNYIVKNKINGKLCVAKSITENLWKISKEFSRELNIIRSLRYPSITNFVGYSEVNFKQKKKPVLITEYYERGDLLSLLRIEKKKELHQKGYDDWNNTKKMICLFGIALGMEYIHNHHIIHRNLKCSNIFLDDNLYPKIGDFSNSTSSNLQIEQTNISNTSSIIAPELINEGIYSFPIDVFSFSLIAYHIYSGNEPFIYSTNKFNHQLSIINGKRPDLTLVPVIYHEFIDELWEQDAEKRPTFKQIIKRFLSDRKIWLENVNEIEIEHYLHQFGLSIKKAKNELIFLQLIREFPYPYAYQVPKKTLKHIISNPLIAENIKNDIIRADDLLLSNPKNPKEFEFYREFFFNIGWIFYYEDKESNIGIEQDFYYAFKYLKQSASYGHIESIYSMATLCLKDISNDSSIQNGIKLLTIAAYHELTPALLLLAQLYKNGQYVEKNLILSAIFYKISADLGEIEGCLLYAKVLKSILYKEIDGIKIKLYLDKAKESLKQIDFDKKYYYIEAKCTIDTIEDEIALLYVTKYYFERVLKYYNDNDASEFLKRVSIEQKNVEYPPQYFDELCKPIVFKK